MPPIPPASTNQLFVYGSLVDPRCLDDVLGRRHAGERLRACLMGYRRVSTEAYPFPFIVAAADASVDGILVMDLTRQDLEVLDEYEEVAAGTYSRIEVEVDAWGCGPRTMRIPAHTYVAGSSLLRLATVPGHTPPILRRA
jgi:gamma-glutamylcyclotransferase (GGCT)/AIG2-like uncharacterized protein YtfP